MEGVLRSSTAADEGGYFFVQPRAEYRVVSLVLTGEEVQCSPSAKELCHLVVQKTDIQ